MPSSTDLNGNVTDYTWYTPWDLGSITLNALNETTRIGYTPLGSGYQFAYLTPPQNQGYWQIGYTMDGSQVSQADIYDPKTIRRHLIFNSGGYLTSEALNYESTPSKTTAYNRAPGSNFVTDVTDALNRDTHYGYDFTTTNEGNLLSVTGLYNTAAAFTTSFTYTPTFNQLKSVEDPLGHITQFLPFSPDANGSVQTFEDAVENTITFTYEPTGQVETATDQAGDETILGYAATGTGDLTSVQDPNGNVTNAGYDGAGRLTSVTDPLRNTTSYQLDGVGNVTQTTDPNGGVTKSSYDQANNLKSITDANGHSVLGPQGNQYDLRNRLINSCNALNKCISYQYDPDDNITQVINANGTTTQYQYDNLNRRT